MPLMRPEIGIHAARELLHAAGVDITKPAIIGRRGYYRDTMGVPGVNDWGLYDDAIIVVTPTAYATYNANCDPSRHHPGVAVLKAGVWRYQLGIHNQSKDPATHARYEALVQAEPVTVVRDPDTTHPERWEDTGWFGINHHRGGVHVTSSEGCQTITPPQWTGYLELVKSEMDRHRVKAIPYLLSDRPED